MPGQTFCPELCAQVSLLCCGKHVIYGDAADLGNASAWGFEALDRLGRHRRRAKCWVRRRGPRHPVPGPCAIACAPWRATAVIGVFRNERSALAAERYVQESLPALTGLALETDGDVYATGRPVGGNGAPDGFAVYLMMR